MRGDGMLDDRGRLPQVLYAHLTGNDPESPVLEAFIYFRISDNGTGPSSESKRRAASAIARKLGMSVRDVHSTTGYTEPAAR